MIVRDAGPKGRGLYTTNAIGAGKFVAEYLGEVVGSDEYVRREAKYAGRRHRYWMSLGGGQFIDAMEMGGVARFINHSCSPNCELQKWSAGGATVVGVYTLEPVPAEDELTVDYHMGIGTCMCGAPACRVGQIDWIAGIRSARALLETNDAVDQMVLEGMKIAAAAHIIRLIYAPDDPFGQAVLRSLFV